MLLRVWPGVRLHGDITSWRALPRATSNVTVTLQPVTTAIFFHQQNRSSSPKEWENERSFRNRRPAQPSAGRPGLRPLSFRPPVAPRNVADSSKDFFPCTSSCCLKNRTRCFCSASDVASSTCQSDRVRSPPRRGAHATLRRSHPTRLRRVWRFAPFPARP